MTLPVQQQANNADTAVTRADLVRLLQKTGRPEPLDVSGQDVRGINLQNCNLEGANLSQARVCEANLRGADLSWASLGGASTFERTRSHLRRGGALFREQTNVIVAERFFLREGRQIRPGIWAWSPLHECGWFPDGVGVPTFFPRTIRAT
jgi:hypothetical protein